MRLAWITLAATLTAATLFAQPAAITAEGVPPVTPQLRERLEPYLEARSAFLFDWHPTRREVLVGTRFSDVTQVHRVTTPMGARRQLTFYPDRVGGASWEPTKGEFFLFSKDAGGGEFFQLYRYDFPSGKVTLLTDGKSRNTGARWSHSGHAIAWSSTRRTGRDTDIWTMNPRDPGSARQLLEVSGGGWGVSDWSHDGKQLIVGEYISANESRLWLVNVADGSRRRLTPVDKEPVSYSSARFSRDGRSVLLLTDRGGEFRRLVRLDVSSGRMETVVESPWDVSDFELSRDGSRLAWVTNEAGVGVLHLREMKSGRDLPLPPLPLGTIGGIEWRDDAPEIGFTLTSAKSPTDVFSIDLREGSLTRWTESETGGLDLSGNVEPELVAMKSFDGLEISAFAYRPDPSRFPGPRPVMVIIHGGPEGQSRPGFLGRNNFFINEMGVALVYPNVRGSSGYGKTFLAMDNGMRREESVRDIGAVLDWIEQDVRLDQDRVMVYGGSYGGYMVLASMIHFADRLKAGIDVVGISDFVTFLQNTQDYRRDLRRAEYGDERDPAMLRYLQSISPLRQAAKIRDPLLVIQGLNDPRVPHTEAEQIVAALRTSGVPVWYVAASDEGHGFNKRPNQDYQMAAMVMFMEQFLLGAEEPVTR